MDDDLVHLEKIGISNYYWWALRCAVRCRAADAARCVAWATGAALLPPMP